MSKPIVTIILSIRNEAKYIETCLETIYSQDLPQDQYEVLAVDGLSEDGTREILVRLQAKYPSLQILDNPLKVVTAAINMGVKHAKGQYIARLDAHAFYAKDYIRTCLETIRETGAADVGGPMLNLPANDTKIAHAIKLALDSPFGLGGGRFHNPNYEGFVETVWPGFYDRVVFDKVGYLTVSIPRSEDIEFNTRVVAAGYKIYMSPKMRSWYYCRPNLKALWKQRWGDGLSVARTLKINPKAPRIRHLTPLVFVTSLILLTALALFLPTGLSPVQKLAVCCRSAVGLKTPVWPYVLKFNLWNLKLLSVRLLILELAAYLFTMLLFVIKAGQTKFNVYRLKLGNKEKQSSDPPTKSESSTINDPTENTKQLRPTVNTKRSFGSLALLPVVFLTLHFSYGLGSLWGLVSLPYWAAKKQKR